MIRRQVALTTDDREEAYAELVRLRAAGQHDWDMAEVRRMDRPVRTTARWAVFRNLAGSDDEDEEGLL